MEVQEGLKKEDVLKELKEKVNLEEIRRNEGKNLTMLVRRNRRNDVEKLIDGCKHKLSNKIKMKVKIETVILRGVDKGLSQKEFGEIIEEEVGNEPHIRISDRERTRVVFMTGEEAKVRELIRKRFVGKGWDRWKVEEIVDPIECYQCEQKGHRAGRMNQKEEKGRI
ncbi:hypothetical protein HHI36_021900 [Cryptolaemus montrouzieri]|uniref:Uncharacterized protein n=1 Tax=Cryptolaemus montrouzieri TaxID=559131 RepID=A0ABD2MZ21_9CUCU